MSTLDLSLLYAGSERGAVIGAGPVPLRIVLLSGEVLRMPRARSTVRVVSGAAWISVSGRDVVLSAGEQLTLATSRESAVVSGLGIQPLLFEVIS